jgi:hypothetical protein
MAAFLPDSMYSKNQYVMFKSLCIGVAGVFWALHALAQADNEIQVYASPTVGGGTTMVELHSNYTIRGSKDLVDAKSARWTNETLEITHGFGANFEVGLYTFTAFSPDGNYEYLGNNIRPRFTFTSVPVGLSISAEIGFYRPDVDSDFSFQGELRPIVDKTINNFYVAFNPNVAFELAGDEKELRLTPQLKAVYTIAQVVGLGFEYYTDLGTFTKLEAGRDQEHLFGPMLDLYASANWELNTGFLFGLTPGSNQNIFKILIGRRFGK